MTILPPPEPNWTSCKELLEKWRIVAIAKMEDHRSSVGSRQLWASLLGIPSTILSAAVGTAIFASLAQETSLSPKEKILIGVVSGLSAVLTSIQTNQRFGERAERHQGLSDRSYALVLEIDHLLVCPPLQNELREVMLKLKDKMASLGVEASAGTTFKILNKRITPEAALSVDAQH